MNREAEIVHFMKGTIGRAVAALQLSQTAEPGYTGAHYWLGRCRNRRTLVAATATTPN